MASLLVCFLQKPLINKKLGEMMPLKSHQIFNPMTRRSMAKQINKLQAYA